MQTTKRQAWAESILGLVYAAHCQLCEQARAERADGFVCADCDRRVLRVCPPFCQRCGLPYPGEITANFECSNCRDLELQFESARAAVIADALLLDVIHRYKYQGAIWFEEFLSRLLLDSAASELSSADWDCIVPVPLHPMRRREREFNQAERLAARLSHATRIPLKADRVRRVVPTQTQTQLSRVLRADNVRNAFASGEGFRNGERCLVFDDVLTTGATTSAVAGILREMGAGRVAVWTLARGL